jgi:hypothetical protein
MFKSLKIISVFLLLFLIFLPSLALAQTSVGKFTFVQGRVDVLRQPAPRAMPVNMGDNVFVGDIIRAKSKSKAEITFTDGNIVRVAPNTRIEISEYMFDEAKGKGILNLSRGKVQAIIQEKIAKRIATFGEANRFEIHTPTAILGVRGTNFIVAYQRNLSSVFVWKGTVIAYSRKFPDMVVTVNAGYITTIPPDQPVQPARPATDAEKKMYEGDFTPGGSGEKSEAESTVISEATTGPAEPGTPEPGPESPLPTGNLTETPQNLTEIVQPPPIIEPPVKKPPDTTPPELIITAPKAPIVTGPGDITVDIEASETVITYSYKLNTKDWKTTNELPIKIPNADMEEGINTLKVKATDAATNTSDPISYQWFVGKTQYSLEGNVTGFLSGSVLSTSEGLRVVSNGNQGAWLLNFSGDYEETMPDSLDLFSGGEGYGPNSEEFDGYWLSKIEDATTSDGSISGTSSFKYLSTTVLGEGTGSVSGTYGSPWQVTDLGLGTYTETPLAFGGNINTGLFQWDQDFWLVADGGLTGLMGVADIKGLPSFLSLGTYNTDYETNNLYNGALWGVDIVDSTPDNGALLGITGGIVLDDSLKGGLLAIYIKPDGEEYETGYILSDSDNINGSLYPGLGMYELGGNLISVSMGTTSILPDNLNWDSIYGDSPSLHIIKGYGNIERDLTGEIVSQNINIADQNWGVWWASSVSYYSEDLSIPSSWTATAEGESYDMDWNIAGIWGSQTIGSRIDTGNKLIGETTGYFADISSIPVTGISVGETLGTFDPNIYTWQAVSMGVWLETNKFLEMAGKIGDNPNIAALQKLNIPCVEVGRASLSGLGNSEGGSINVNMNDVIFFAPNTGARPSIWATNAVSGNYTGNPLGAVVPLSGNGLNANFNVQQWDTTNSKWLSNVTNGQGSITGGGQNVQNLNFHGAAAGTINQGSGSFSGTGAGIAK